MRIRSGSTVLYASILLGLSFWVLDALVDSIFFYEAASSGSMLVNIPAFEIYFRSIVSALIVGFGYFASRVVNRIRAAEDARSGSEELYRTLFENTPLGLGIADLKGNLLDFNDGMLKPGNYTREDIERIGNVARLYYDPADRDRLLWKASVEGALHREEVQFVRKDGTPFDSLLSLTKVHVNGQECWQALVEDITGRKRAEAELIRTQRLRAIVELTAGISHNLNNLLVGILGPLDLIGNVDDPELQNNLNVIRTSAERARDLVRRLNESVRGEREADLKPVQVNEVALQALEMCRPRWKDEPEARGVSIRLETVLKAVQPVRGTHAGLHEILVNLVFNAVDAMPEGGTLTVCTQDVEASVHIVVSDTGIGLCRQTMPRIFEPFYTTKMNVGTGLGLSTVHSTVTRWGGSIEVDSSPGEGAAFTIRLPACAAPVEMEPTEVSRKDGRR